MVYDFHLRFKELSCLKTLKTKMLEAIQFGGCLEETFRKNLKETGLRFMKTVSNREVLMEKYDIQIKR